MPRPPACPPIAKRPDATRTRKRPDATPTPERPDANGTRERILDIALDLFSEQGYDKTSLREIAEQLGFSKAALYYHFASKDQILLALHLRLHELGREAFARLDLTETGTEGWGALLQDVIGDMLANRKLLVLHERNHGAFESIQAKHPHHDADHEDFEAAFKQILTDKRVPMLDRVRLGCAVGAIIAGLLLYSTAFSDIPVDEYEKTLSEVLADVLSSAGPSRV